MAIWTCVYCEERFERNRCGKRGAKFCSQKCYHQWNRESEGNSGSFRKGNKSWNKGTKGVMKANLGSFQLGIVPKNKLNMGDTTIRRDVQGHQRAWIKTNENGNPYDWEMNAVIIWRKHHGDIPIGMLIHHKDRDTLNDKITNLQLVTRAEHLLEHRPEYEKRRRRAVSKATKARHARNRAARK